MFKKETTVKDYITIIVTHECNRQCPFCIDRYRGELQFISLQQVERALAVAKRRNISDVLLVGGEPTLHPDILAIAKRVKEYGFNLILTTNYDYPDIVKQLDAYVDSFNISHYDQKELPDPKDFSADITLSKLLYQGGIDTKGRLDAFITRYEDDYHLKFSTLTVCNEWGENNHRVPYLDDLITQRIVLFGEIEGNVYRGHIIKRHDRVVNPRADQSLKCHPNGRLSYAW